VVSTSKLVSIFSVADRFISFEAGAQSCLDLVRQFLTGYFLKPVTVPDPTIPIAHAIRIHSDQFSLPEFPSTAFEIEDGRCFVNLEKLLLDVNGSMIEIGDRASATSDVWLSETTAQRHPLALNNAILYAVQGALRRAGLYQLHAAAVLPPESASNRGILFVGASGSGKSTWTALLTVLGWRFVSDDNLLLSYRNEDAVVWAFRRDFALAEPTLALPLIKRFESFTNGLVPSDERKLRFAAHRAFPERFVASCTPRVLFFPEITDAVETSVQPLNQSEALIRLLGQCPWAAYDPAVARAHQKALRDLSCQATSYSLLAGKDVVEEPAEAAEIINRVISYSTQYNGSAGGSAAL